MLGSGGGPAAEEYVGAVPGFQAMLERVGRQRGNVLPPPDTAGLDATTLTEATIHRDPFVLVSEDRQREVVELGLSPGLTDEFEDSGLEVRHGDVFPA